MGISEKTVVITYIEHLGPGFVTLESHTLCCLFFQTSKPELNNLKVFSSRDSLLLRRPRWSSFITHTSTLFCHFVKFFFFTIPPSSVKRHSRVARPLYTRHGCTRNVPTHHPWLATRVTLNFVPPSYFFSFFFFPFFPLNYCNNSAPAAPKKA